MSIGPCGPNPDPPLKERAREVASSLREYAHEAGQPGRDTRAILRRIWMRGSNWIASLGPSGQKMAADLRAIDQRAAKRAARNASDIRALLQGLTRRDRRIVARVLNRRPVPELKNRIPRRLADKADRLREILDRDMEAARALGMERLVAGIRREIQGSGKAFPQVLNREGRAFLREAAARGLGSPKVAAIAERMFRRGQANSIEDALDQILRYRSEVLRGVNRYLERSRLELPDRMIEWDPNLVLPRLLEANARTIEGVRQWGVNFERADALIGRIDAESETGNGRIIQEFISQQFGLPGMSAGADNRFAGFVSNYETLARLGGSILSALRNMGQRVTNTADLPLSAQVRALIDFPPIANRWIRSARELGRRIERTGAVRGRSSVGEFEASGPLRRLTEIALKPFTAAERGNHITTALAARYALEHDIKRLVRLREHRGGVRKVLEAMLAVSTDPEGATVRRMNRLGLSSEQVAELVTSGRRLTEQEIETAMHRLVSDRQFPLTLATERIWWSTHPWMRLAAKFKPFVLDQTGLMYELAVKETIKGNFAPMMKFAAWTMLMGEVYNVARDLITGDEESLTLRTARRPDQRTPGAVAYRLLLDMADGGGVGILADLVWGVSNFLGGPVLTTLDNLGEAASHVIQRRSVQQVKLALHDLANQEVSIGRQVGPLVRRIETRFGKSNDRYFSYRRWRGRTYEFRDANDGSSTAERAALDVLRGRVRDFETTGRTLSYDYAARAITAGSIDDAAEFLAELLRGAETKRERLETFEGAERSADARSPLGIIADADMPRFLAQFPERERQAARRLNREWLRDYYKALGRAMQETRADARDLPVR